MEPEQIRYSVIARLADFDELQQPLQTAAKKHRFLSDNYRSKDVMIATWGERYSSKQDQEKMRAVSISETHKGEKQPEGFISTGSKKSSSGFRVTPTKELCCGYLQKPTSFASKHVIGAQAKPPHRREKHRNVGRRVNQQNLKPNHHNLVNPIKPKIRKTENSLGCLSPFSAPTGSPLVDMRRGQFPLLENKAKVSTKFSDSETLAAEVKLRLTSSPCSMSKDESDNLFHCSGYHLECQTNLEEGNQPSPVSVLESMFDGEMLENIDKIPFSDFLGLEQQLEILKYESIETYYSEGGMVVSSDDESDESNLDSETKENEESEPFRSLGVKDESESSYSDTVLAEAGLGNARWDLNKWDSVDLPINSMIFEKLEKKYIEQTSWKRSERRLLFDRVNSGLVEILESYIGSLIWKKLVSRRLGYVLRLREELHKLLAMQEKRAKKASSTKMPAIDGNDWLELEVDIEPVVQELETMLVDELLSELVHFE